MRVLRMLLNAPFSGPQTWFLHAIRQGYLSDAGITLELTEGTGAYNAAGNHGRGGFDLSYGDLYALAEVRLTQGEASPLCIYATFRRSAAAIAVRADSDIKTLHDLRAARLLGHGSDVALQTFPAFAQAAGITESSPRIDVVEGAMADLFAGMKLDQGLFGYVSTISSSLAAAGQSPQGAVRWFRYADVLPDFYGSGLMAARHLTENEPDLLRAIVRALNRGLRETITDLDAGIDAVLTFNPDRSAPVERLRWAITLAEEMRPSTGPAAAFGEIDPARLDASLRLHCATKRLGPAPSSGEIFTSAFLPDSGERFSTFSRPGDSRT